MKKQRILFHLIMTMLCNGALHAQGLPEQDACGAIQLQGGVFNAELSYMGYGNVLTPSSCIYETNSVWLKLVVQTAGTINFTITPVNATDDYDFVVYNITGKTCNDADGSTIVRCNWFDVTLGPPDGKTGISSSGTGVTSSYAGTPFLTSINAVAGETYEVLVNNYYASQYGFSIDLTASTATFMAPRDSGIQLYVSPSAIMTIGSASTVAMKGGDVLLDNDITGSGKLLMNGSGLFTQHINGRNHAIPSLDIANTKNVYLDSALYVNTGLFLDAGLLYLGDNNITLSNIAAINGANATSYAVTNGAGFFSVQGLSTNSPFNFPVGYSSGDYTPASVFAVSGGLDYSVRVLPNNGVAPLTLATAPGVNRVWQIIHSASGNADIRLTHNAANEINGYNNSTGYVSQQVTNGVWDTVRQSTWGLAGYSNYIVPAALSSAHSWFTKTSDPVNSVSANSVLDLTVALQGPMGATGMSNNLQHFNGVNNGLIPNACPFITGDQPNYNFTTNPAGLSITDWIQVQVLDGATPVAANPLQVRNLLLQTNGHIVDTDGTVPVFTGRTATSRVAIRPRNHMAVLSNVLTGTSFRGQKAYDFTGALANASNVFGDQSQMVLKNGKWCLWGGDVNRDLFIDGGDIAVINGDLGINDGAYNAADFTMDGFVDGAELSVMDANLQFGPYSTLLNY